ncbi:MAG TPA: agmatinase [Candidatus Norongarragalinales archaeon]|jgi:agmatinase|nr:agmatinase [Candidatus Norongarragalinales archaeon]
MKSFLDANKFYSYELAKVAVLPVPFEGTVSYGHGTAKGPDAIIEASNALEWFDEELKQNVAEKIGVHTLPELKPAKTAKAMVESTEKAIGKVLADGKWPLVLGGEHSVSAGAIFAAKKKYPDLSVLWLDAHLDFRDEFDGDKWSHACPLRRVWEKGVNFVHVGARSYSEEEWKTVEKNKLQNRIVSVEQLRKDPKAIQKALPLLSKHVYISVDIDVLDSKEMPATGTPEPGGLSWHELLSVIKVVCEKKNVVGADVMELAPIKGQSAWNYTAARLAYKLLTCSAILRG